MKKKLQENFFKKLYIIRFSKFRVTSLLRNLKIRENKKLHVDSEGG